MFGLINLNTNLKKCKSKVTLFNDNGLVDSYDFVAIGDKEFLFSCLQ